MDPKSLVATNLRRIRQALGITQEELAHRSDLSVRYIGAVERAEASASITIIDQIATALGVDPGELLRRTP
jgi:transcriptional regulator with XRE-family HTH domain